MLKLYGQYRSRAFRVAWLCKESNIPYEHHNVTINVEGATCKEPWYAALNPNQRVPTIDDDGLVMWESAAINLYLAEKYKSPLWPKDATGKARALQWAFYIANDVEPAMIVIQRNRYMLPPEKRDAAAADEAEKQLVPKMKVMEAYLAKHRHFSGDAWGLADFMVASVCYSMWINKFTLLDQFPTFKAWLDASVERPGAKEARKLRE
ncbi:MAG TPA: glutathione S-transferase family protein [Burkholderiales bacterium]|nr:glutathione S-transferase family protein [Burkholderiales bacterium]